MAKKNVYFDAIPLSEKFASDNTYRWAIDQEQTKRNDEVYQELINKFSWNLNPKMLQFLFENTISETAALVATDAIPRSIGCLKFAIAGKGTLKSPYGKFDPETCSAVVCVFPLGNFKRNVDLSKIAFVNRRDVAIKVSIIRVATVGADVSGVITKGKPFMVIGTNLQYLPGDSVTISYIEEDEELSLTITPKESDINHLSFDWPAGLSEVEAGTELKILFKTRGGVAESDVQTNEVTVKVVDAA